MKPMGNDDEYTTNDCGVTEMGGNSHCSHSCSRTHKRSGIAKLNRSAGFCLDGIQGPVLGGILDHQFCPNRVPLTANGCSRRTPSETDGWPQRDDLTILPEPNPEQRRLGPLQDRLQIRAFKKEQASTRGSDQGRCRIRQGADMVRRFESSEVNGIE